MSNLRRWQIPAGGLYLPVLAADVRRSLTHYLDDQTWAVLLGGVDEPAISLETRYGGRVLLANLVPMWLHDGRSIHQAQTFATAPVITAFAPGYMRLEGRLTDKLHLEAEIVVFDSQSVGGQFTVRNTGALMENLRLDLYAQVATERRKIPLAILTLVDEMNALSLGRMLGLEPVVLLEGADADIIPGRKASPQIGASVEILAGESVTLRWSHAGLAKMMDSLDRARFWLTQEWSEVIGQIDALAASIPDVETGNEVIDAAIAFSYQQVMQAFINPTEHLPNAAIIGKRAPGFGFSERGDGTDYGRGWDAQDPFTAYLLTAAVASVDPKLAQGVLQNFLAVQREDGWIDAGPGLGNQREDMLCLPLLARMAWTIYSATGDKLFVEAVYPRLLVFFNRWFEQDFDKDLDAIPEWQDERQTGYIFWPTFAAGQPWSQGVDIRRVETPDLAAYLISEAEALQQLAQAINDPGAYEIGGRLQDLLRLLEQMWHAPKNRYAYQDRDTGAIIEGVTLVEEAPGDSEQILAHQLDVPSRLNIRVTGGTRRVPRATLTLDGSDADGNTIKEQVALDEFTWRYSTGTFTSENTYSRLDRVQFEGLSRVFRFSVNTVDFTRLDLNAVMPLITTSLSTERAEALIERITDENAFLQPNGLTLVAADDPGFDPAGAVGGGGVWPYWTTLIAEGLIARGQNQLATTLLKRLLAAQTAVLTETNQFAEFYHTSENRGLGDEGRISGAVPLYLLMRVLGVQIRDARGVWVGGPFTWGASVTVTQHGVVVMRSENATKVTFPSGHSVDLTADAPWQWVEDAAPPEGEMAAGSIQPIHAPQVAAAPSTNRVIIEVEHDDDDEPNGDS